VWDKSKKKKKIQEKANPGIEKPRMKDFQKRLLRQFGDKGECRQSSNGVTHARPHIDKAEG
jgi:hypothetical protein